MEEQELDLALYNEALEQEQRELEVSTMRKHRLKTMQPYFDLSKRGLKPYEIRNNDRLFQTGDIIELYCIRKAMPWNRLELRCTDGTWINWPVYSSNPDTLGKGIAGNQLSLDDFPDGLVEELECIIYSVTFVLPGQDEIGLHADHVILSLVQENKRLAPFEDGWTPKPDMQLPIEFPGMEKRPIPSEATKGLKDRKSQLGDYQPEPDPLKEDGPYTTETGPGYKEEYRENPANQIQDTVPKEDIRAIPGGVFYDDAVDDFYLSETNRSMGTVFYNEWANRYLEFPVRPKLKKLKGDKPKA